jgi:tRNA pseudouridine55 synthase
LTGALLVDKPAGVTSHDVVARVRREREKGTKVGHAGTLDPFATGLLIVLLGRATRLQRYLLDLPKTYVATARLGWRSTTGDPDGELTETGVIPAELSLPTGQVEQTLPMTSAVKVDGERLYKKAHRGEVVETPTRMATIHRAELIGSEERERATFEVECASGTYVRTLIETLEDAYCESLRRTSIGPHELRDGKDFEISAGELMAFLPERSLDADEADAVSHGRAVEGRRGPAQDASPKAVFSRPETDPAAPAPPVRLTHDGSLIAIARQDGENLRPEVVLV